MISNRDLHEELEKIEKAVVEAESDYDKAMLKAQSLQVKLLYNLRTNMVTTMRALNVPMKSNEKVEDGSEKGK
jgi:hypothetical protein